MASGQPGPRDEVPGAWALPLDGSNSRVGVDCVGSVLFGQTDWPRRLQSGLGNSLHPPNLDHDHDQIDEVHWLADHEAFHATRELARAEKLFAGNTSGSVYRVLREVALRSAPGTAVVGIFPDRGDRYADTVYADEHWIAHGMPEHPGAARPRRVLPGTPVTSWSHLRKDESAPRPALLFVESNTTGTGMRALALARDKGFEPVFAGGMIPELFRLAAAADLLAAQLDLAAGVPHQPRCVPAGYAGIRFLTAPHMGVLASIDGTDEARTIAEVTQVTVTAHPGDRVAPAIDAYGRLGYVIAHGVTRADVMAALSKAHAAITVRTVD
ncbi:hypothetical protein [Actinokineospora sp.]|uniref:hypothetical protein n=1 Tax=Actinokineospora sp. TaxID=1872133 RepID=UPI003D6A9A1B